MAKDYTDPHNIIGIPDRTTTHDLPEVEHGVGNIADKWEYVVQDHQAERAGQHFDLRLGDPSSGAGHSWAIPKGRMPKPGEKLLAVRQPTHTIGYFDFEGRIAEGYGAGDVSIKDRGQTEIIRSTPDKVKFGIYRGSGPEEYNLIHTKDNNWLLMNSTKTRDNTPELPSDKPKMKDMSPEKVVLDDGTQVMTAKIDGAHNVFLLEGGKPVRSFSYRESKRAPGGLIEHSHKMPALYNTIVPKGLKQTIVRGEVWAKSHKTNKPLPAAEVGGMLNASVWKSREKQDKLGKLRPSLFNIEKYDGEDVSTLPYEEKLKFLEHVREIVPEFLLPARAYTPGQKRELLEKIESGDHPETKEGVVLHSLFGDSKPEKVKFKHQTDVIIRGFFPGTGKYKGKAVGGFYYAHESNPDTIVGKVGTGFSDKLRADMMKNPEEYVGRVAKVEGLEIYEKDGKPGAIQKPAFKEFHLDKDYSDLLTEDRKAYLAKALKRRLKENNG